MNTGSPHVLVSERKTSAGVFERAFRTSPAMQSVMRLPDGVLVEVNDTFTAVLGYSREEIVGKTAQEINFWVRPEKLPLYREALLAHGRVRDFEVEVRTKDGRQRIVLLSSDVVEIDGAPHAISAGVDITARKQTEAALQVTAERLRQSEERFSKVFRANPAIVALTRFTDGKIVSVNEAFVRALGYTEVELLGRTAAELSLHATSQQREPFMRELAANGSVRGVEWVLCPKNGERRTLLVSGELTEIDGVPHVLSVGLDITERKEAEAKLRESELRLRESEARFATAFQSSPVFMAIATRGDGRFVEINDAFAEGVGLSRAEVIGRNSLELNLWVSADERNQFYAQVAPTGSLHNVETRIRCRGGPIRTMQLSAECVEINRVPHMLTFGVDITQRKQAEQGLRESEARARSLYQSVSAAIVVQDETGFVDANPAALKMFGAARPEDFFGRHPKDFSAPTQPDGEESSIGAQRHVARAMAEGFEHFEWLARRLDGSFIPVEVTLTTINLAGKTVIQAVMFDLSERKRAESELQRALTKERELNQLKSDFVSLVSHEFRTPLEVIMSSADNLDRYHDRLPPAKRGQLLGTINKSVRRMSGMMEEVLLLGRMDSHRVDFKPVPFNLAAFCRRLRDEMESATNGRCPVKLTLGKLPAKARGDESVIRHILTNLLSNAVKYSAAGQPVQIAVSRQKSEVVFQVSDQGCGIPAVDQPRLFEAFHRAANVRHIAGTGLGLVIVQRCVTLHGGRIEVESMEGKGTTFTVSLPLLNRTAKKHSA